MEISDVAITGILTIIGTIILEIVKRWLVKSKEKDDTASNLRKELNDEVYRLRTELRTADSDLDKWRDENLELKSNLLRVKFDLQQALDLLRTRGNMTDDEINAEMKEIQNRQQGN